MQETHAVLPPRRRPRAQLAVRLSKSLMVHSVLLLWAAASLGPFFWMLGTSLKEWGQVFIFPPVWIPDPITTEAYSALLASQPLFTWTLNTAIVATTVVIGQVISCSLAAYAFARLNFPGRDKLFLLYLGTMMIPGRVTLIPTYILFNQIGVVNTLWG